MRAVASGVTSARRWWQPAGHQVQQSESEQGSRDNIRAAAKAGEAAVVRNPMGTVPAAATTTALRWRQGFLSQGTAERPAWPERPTGASWKATAAVSVIRLGLLGHSKTSGSYAGDGKPQELLKGGVPRADMHSRRFPLRAVLRACCGWAQRARAEVRRPLRRPLRQSWGKVTVTG